MRIIEVENQGGEVIDGEVYDFACFCGESFKTADAAWNCRKCRTYLSEESFNTRSIYHFTGDRDPTPHYLIEKQIDGENHVLSVFDPWSSDNQVRWSRTERPVLCCSEEIASAVIKDLEDWGHPGATYRKYQSRRPMEEYDMWDRGDE